MRMSRGPQLLACRVREITGALALTAALFSSASQAQSPTAASAGRLNPLGDLGLAGLDAFRERPLFSPDRRPPSTGAGVVLTVPEAPRIRPNFRLLGTVQGPSGAVARIEDGDTGRSYSVEIGETVGLWAVTAIEPSNVTLEKNGQAETFQFAKSAGPVAVPSSSEATRKYNLVFGTIAPPQPQ